MNEVTHNVLDLFAGIGGASYAGKLIGGWRTVCYVENDVYCQRVIRQRIKDGIFDDAPIWSDVQTFDGKPWCGSVDIITAGFPCQPFSVAGKQKGESDERNMWPDTVRIIGEVRPRFAFLENVPALITSGYFGRILGDLSEIGYDCRWTIVSACSIGASHTRERLFIVSYPEKDNGARVGSRKREVQDYGAYKIWGGSVEERTEGYFDVRLATEPDGSGMADGIPDRNDRVAAIGNAFVPAVAATAWRILTS